MTWETVMEKINQDFYLRIYGLLVVDKILKPMNNSTFFADMDPAFLEEIQSVTGTANGFAVVDNDIYLYVKADRVYCWELLEQYVLAFDKESGKCKGYKSITLYNEQEECCYIPESVDDYEYNAIRKHLLRSIKISLRRAAKHGYIKANSNGWVLLEP